MAASGYFKTDRGRLRSAFQGRHVTPDACFVWLWLCLEADHRTGEWVGCAGVIGASLHWDRRRTGRALEKLQAIGWIEYAAPRFGNYPIRLIGFLLDDGSPTVRRPTANQPPTDRQPSSSETEHQMGVIDDADMAERQPTANQPPTNRQPSSQPHDQPMRQPHDSRGTKDNEQRTTDPSAPRRSTSSATREEAEALIAQLSPRAQELIEICRPVWKAKATDVRACQVYRGFLKLPTWKVEGGLEKFIRPIWDRTAQRECPSYLEQAKPLAYAASIVAAFEQSVVPSRGNGGGNGAAKPLRDPSWSGRYRGFPNEAELEARDAEIERRWGEGEQRGRRFDFKGVCQCTKPTVGMHSRMPFNGCSECFGKVIEEAKRTDG